MININYDADWNMLRIINDRIKPGYPKLDTTMIEIGVPLAENAFFRNTSIVITGRAPLTGSRKLYYNRVNPSDNYPTTAREQELTGTQTWDTWIANACRKFGMLREEFDVSHRVKPADGTMVTFTAYEGSLLYIGSISIKFIDKGWPDIAELIPSPRRITVLDPGKNPTSPRRWQVDMNPTNNMTLIMEDYYPELKGKGYKYKFEVQSVSDYLATLVVTGVTNITGTVRIPLTRLDMATWKNDNFSEPVLIWVPISPEDQDKQNRLFWNNGTGNKPSGLYWGRFATTGAYPQNRGVTGNVGFHANDPQNNLFVAGQLTWRVIGD